jgi:hypothetical protein
LLQQEASSRGATCVAITPQVVTGLNEAHKIVRRISPRLQSRMQPHRVAVLFPEKGSKESQIKAIATEPSKSSSVDCRRVMKSESLTSSMVSVGGKPTLANKSQSVAPRADIFETGRMPGDAIDSRQPRDIIRVRLRRSCGFNRLREQACEIWKSGESGPYAHGACWPVTYCVK